MCCAEEKEFSFKVVVLCRPNKCTRIHGFYSKTIISKNPCSIVKALNIYFHFLSFWFHVSGFACWIYSLFYSILVLKGVLCDIFT